MTIFKKHSLNCASVVLIGLFPTLYASSSIHVNDNGDHQKILSKHFGKTVRIKNGKKTIVDSEYISSCPAPYKLKFPSEKEKDVKNFMMNNFNFHKFSNNTHVADCFSHCSDILDRACLYHYQRSQNQKKKIKDKDGKIVERNVKIRFGLNYVMKDCMRQCICTGDFAKRKKSNYVKMCEVLSKRNAAKLNSKDFIKNYKK